jgi:hypothetical protein
MVQNGIIKFDFTQFWELGKPRVDQSDDLAGDMIM